LSLAVGPLEDVQVVRDAGILIVHHDGHIARLRRQLALVPEQVLGDDRERRALATVFAAGVAIAVLVAAGVILPSPPPHAALSTVPAVTTHSPMPAHRFKKECILVLPSQALPANICSRGRALPMLNLPAMNHTYDALDSAVPGTADTTNTP